MRVGKLYLLVFLCLTVSTVSAQKTWEKPFQKWSQEDAVKILSNSPWVQEYQSIEGMTAIQQQEISKDQANLHINPNYSSGAASSNPGSKGRNLAVPAIMVRLHSALPIRQAFVRLQEIAAGYDKMDEQKKAEFDAKTKSTLDCPLCQKFYIVTMNKSVNTSGQNVEDGLFQTMNLEQLKGNIWLMNDKGEKQNLAQFIAPKGAKDLAIFFFPRKDAAGNDFITPQSKTFKFVFNNEFLTNNNPYAKFLPREFEFKVSNLKLGDGITF